MKVPLIKESCEPWGKTSFQEGIVNVYGAEWKCMHACGEKAESSDCPTVAVLLTAQNIAAASLSVSSLHCSNAASAAPNASPAHY